MAGEQEGTEQEFELQVGEEFVDMGTEVAPRTDEQEVASEEVKKEALKKEEDDGVPDKYKGKTLKEIATMHSEAEKLIGRQGQDLGELRKLTDQILQQQLTPKAPQEETKVEEVDFFTDPKAAIDKAVSTHPSVVAAQQASEFARRDANQRRVASEHPDFQEVAGNPEFQAWVLKSNVRKRLFAEAANYDVDAALEILGTWKELHPVAKQSESGTVETIGALQRESGLKAAGVPEGGQGGQDGGTKKIYRRADLIRLRMDDPARYEMMSDEIMSAYREGRVR